jgi:hypothetical protein
VSPVRKPEGPLELERLGLGPVARDADLAGAGRQDTGQHPEDGGLAGAVGAEEADDLSRGDGEADVGGSHHLAVALGQSSGFDHPGRGARTTELRPAALLGAESELARAVDAALRTLGARNEVFGTWSRHLVP